MPSPARDLVGYGGLPPRGRWPAGARVAVSLVLNVEEGSERRFAYGDGVSEPGEHPFWPNGQRDLHAESMYDYGSQVGIWRLLELFDAESVPATAFACAVALESDPRLAQLLVERAHEVAAHGYRWSTVTDLDRDTERELIRRTVESITATTGERPVGWYCKYAPSPNTRELLAEEGGFLYDCDSYNDDLPYWSVTSRGPHLVLPYSFCANDMKFRNGRLGPAHEFEAHLVEHLAALLDAHDETPRMMSVGLHPRIVGRPGRARALRNFIRYAQSRDGVWFARRRDIAEHWTNHIGGQQ